MKTLFLSLWLLVVSGTVSEARIPFTDSITYPVMIRFQSFCCGVPSEIPLRKCIIQFRKKYRIKSIKAWKYAPMGREGEYDLAFPLTEMTRTQKSQFIKKLQAVVPRMKDKGSARLELNYMVVKEDLPAQASRTAITY